MLGAQVTGPVQPVQQQEDGGLLGGIVQFLQENPTLAGGLAGAAFEGIVGGDIGAGAEEGMLGAERLLAFKRQKKLDQQKMQLAKMKITQSQNQELLKNILPLQQKGATLATKEDLDLLPNEAFFTVGIGQNQIRLKKPAPQLSAESAAKVAVLSEAKSNAQELISEIDKGVLTTELLNIASAPGAKRLTEESRQVKSRLELISEGLGRSLSGAAIPESEIKAFRDLFSVQVTDSAETARFKLNRAVRIIDNVERNAGIFLQGQGRDTKNKRNLSEYLKKEIKSAESQLGKKSTQVKGKKRRVISLKELE